MADELEESNLEESCYKTIKKEITTKNVNYIKKMASKYRTWVRNSVRLFLFFSIVDFFLEKNVMN